jgi:drug/metabolite transporter (DMT)-like permease
MEVRQRPMLALAIRLLAAFLLSVMLMLVKVVGSRGVSLVETMFWRQGIPTLLIGGWLAATGQQQRFRTERFKAHVVRAVYGTIGMFLTLGVVLLLPLAESTVLGFLSPVFAVILAAILLKEKVGPIRWTAVALGFAGVLIIAGPDRSHLPLPGLAVGVGAAFMVALVSIQLRDLGRTEHPLTTVFWFSALSTVALAIPALWAGSAHDGMTWALLGAIGIAGTLGQVALTAALRLGSVSSVIVMDYSQFGWATLWGLLVFSQLPPAATWIGGPVIIAAGLVIVWREHRLRVEKPAGGLGS